MSTYHCQDKYFYDKISKLPVNKMNTEFLAKWRPQSGKPTFRLKSRGILDAIPFNSSKPFA